FQAEDGIRDLTVTGVQTCALPISVKLMAVVVGLVSGSASADNTVINFTGSYGPGAACAARFDFPVGANTTTIDVAATADVPANEIGRASCRERVWVRAGAAARKKQ